jgi:hypothetical protein
MRKYKLMLLGMVVGVAAFAAMAGGSAAQLVCPPGVTSGSGCTDTYNGVSFSAQTVTVTNGIAPITVGCPTGTPGGCTGNIVVNTANKVLVKVQVAAKKKKILKVGSANFGTIPAGQKKKVKVKLSKAALKLLNQKGKLGTIGTVTAKDGNGITKKTKRNITLKKKK